MGQKWLIVLLNQPINRWAELYTLSATSNQPMANHVDYLKIYRPFHDQEFVCLFVCLFDRSPSYQQEYDEVH